MKIDSSTIAYIQNVVRTADLVKISNIIIEPDRVRAIDDDRSVVLFQDHDVPVMPFGSVGLNRTDVFSSRFELTKSSDDFRIEAVVETPANGNAFARALTMKGKGIKVDYRCANPLTIQAPKALNDAVRYSVDLTPDIVQILQKGQAAMSATEVTFIGSKDGVSLEMSDVNCDALTYQFADSATIVGPDCNEVKFSHRYLVKTILPLIKANPDGQFFLTTRGILKITVNGLDVFVMPRT